VASGVFVSQLYDLKGVTMKNRFFNNLFRFLMMALFAFIMIACAPVAKADSNGATPVSPEVLAGIAGTILSLAFTYIPGLNDKYDALSKASKQAVMGVLLVIITVAIFGLACSGFAADFNLAVSCDRGGAVSAFNILLAALVANQSVYVLTRK
jgi:hypothetical protein